MAKDTPFGIDDILKAQRPQQFPVDEILNEEERRVRGWVSVEVKDKQGEVVPIDDLKRTITTWIDRGGPISDQHTNRIVGKGLRWFEGVHPKTGKKAIAIDYRIHKDYTVDDQVWGEIKSGRRKGLSFGGRATGQPDVKMDDYSGEPARNLHGLETYEIASVYDPANQFAENFMVNFLAKSAGDAEKQDEMPETDKDALSITVFGRTYGALEPEQKKEIDARVKEFVKMAFKQKRVVERNGRYCVVHCHGPEAGKPIKCFDTRGEAEAMHRAIQANKMDDLLKIMGEEEMKAEEVNKPDDKRPPKEWFDRCVAGVRESGGADDPAAVCGNLWHNVMNKSDEEKNKALDDFIASQAPEKAIDLKGSETKEKAGKKMAGEKRQENEDEKPQNSEPATKQSAPQPSPEMQILKQICDKLDTIAQSLTKQEPPIPPKKPEDEKEPKEEEKQANPDPEGGKVKLPKAPVGETDETAKPETDEVSIMEKSKKFIDKAVEDKLKALGIVKGGETPRPKADVRKQSEPKQDEFALKMLAKAKKGELDTAAFNREIKKHIRTEYDKKLRDFMEQFNSGQEGA